MESHPRVLDRRMFAALLLAILAVCPLLGQPPGAQPKAAPLQASLDSLVSKLREEKKLIGLSAVVMVDGKIEAASADGVRKKGADAKLTANDRFHIGSITKSFTATVAARLIERGQIQWDTTLVQCFGDEIEIHDQWKTATLEHFLTHTSGAQPNFGLTVMIRKPPPGKERTKARREAVEGIVRNPPKSKPGERHKYSNVGFTIAGAMLEQTTGKTWEELVQEEVFAPLKLKQTGYGPPKDKDKPLSQPQGHSNVAFLKVAAGQDADNTPIMGPAGTIHMSLSDLCHYGNEHLRGEQGNGKLLKGETYQRLHKPRLNNYACGWVVPNKHRATEGRFFWHNGSNTMWFAMLGVLPDLKTVVAVGANDGDIPGGQSAAFQIIDKMGEAVNNR